MAFRDKQDNGKSHDPALSKVVNDVISRFERGEVVDCEEIERAHPQLMPGLSDRLRRLRQIHFAASGVKEQRSAESVEAGKKDGETADLHFLRTHLSGFDVAEQLDRGGQGRVYRAVQESTKRIVAIKVLSDGPFASGRQRARFSREIELVSRLRHPNIVTVYESGVIEGRPYYAMEYIDGLPLDDYALLEQPDLRTRVKLFVKVCEAVRAAHQQGVIHRDLKPANILVDEDGEPHVLDFGLAKEVTEDWANKNEARTAPLSMPGQVVGTLHYLSPEQVSGFARQSDVRSDIYALGVVLYELIAGVLPYSSTETQHSTLQSIVAFDPIGLRATLRDQRGNGPVGAADVNIDLERIVAKTLSKEPERRYQSAAALAEDLTRYLDGDVVEARAASSAYLIKRAIRKYRVHVSVALAFVLLLVAALIVTTWALKQANQVAHLAQVGLRMGSFVRDASVTDEPNRAEESIQLLKQAIALSELVPKTDPLIFRQLFSAHAALGRLYRENGAIEAAKEQGRILQGFADDLLAKYGDEPELLRTATLAYRSQAYTAAADKDWERAYRFHQLAIPILKRLVQQETDHSRYRYELAVTLAAAEQSMRRTGRVPEGKAALDEAMAIFEGASSKRAGTQENRHGDLSHAGSKGRLAS